MWTVVSAPPDSAAPSSRSKHSATLLGAHVYLLGGRNGNVPLKDLWRYNLAECRWEQLTPAGERPPCLQEHSAVAHRESLYVFGGEVGFSAGTETPLWVYQVKSNTWRKIRAQKGVSVPRGRRGHSALVHRGAMLVYGGYQDLRGSSNELWGFHFDTESWHLLSSPGSGGGSGTGRTGGGGNHGDHPPARHKHSAILHDDSMWVYGGMTDLQERADLWRWDTVSKSWSCIKVKAGPGPLHSHAACKLPSSMLVFGGERDGHPTDELWRFHFGTETWERLLIQGSRPQPRAESVALTVSCLLLQDETPPASGETGSSGRSHRSRGGGSVDRSINPRHSSYHPHNNRVSPCERKYVFRPTSVNYVDGSPSETVISTRPVTGNAGFLREISKLSQINLSRLSHHKCSYSVLTSSSRDDSTESLLHQAGEGAAEPGTPSKMVKSQSANVISRKRQGGAGATMQGALGTPSPDELVPAPVISVTRHHGNCSAGVRNGQRLTNGRNHNHLTSTSCGGGRPLPRDPVSVPNFGTLTSTLPTPVLTPVEMTRLVYLDDEVFGRELETAVIQIQQSSDFSALHRQFQPQGFVVPSSTSSNGDTSPVYQNIPKSASAVRFRQQLTQFDEISDETASTSDYASIETVNRLSSNSNYSVCSRPSPVVDTQLDELGRTTAIKPNGRTSSRTPSKDGPFGFCNPNYMGPDIQTILSRKSWQVTTLGENNRNQFQTYARLLNSPPDSVLEDSTGRSISGQFYRDDPLELTYLESPTPKERVPPRFLALGATPYSTTPVPADRRKKSRASSASRAEKVGTSERAEEMDMDDSCFSLDPPLPLYMYLLGGKEQGQINMFKRQVSVWKLQLAPSSIDPCKHSPFHTSQRDRTVLSLHHLPSV